MPTSWSVFFFFNHKWVLHFVRSFFCIYWDDHMVFLLWFVNVVCHIDLWMLKNPCILEINPTLSWCVVLLMFCWIQFAGILLSVLWLCSSVILACHFFCVCGSIAFLCQGYDGLIEWAWEYFFLCNFWEEFQKDRH